MNANGMKKIMKKSVALFMTLVLALGAMSLFNISPPHDVQAATEPGYEAVPNFEFENENEQSEVFYEPPDEEYETEDESANDVYDAPGDVEAVDEDALDFSALPLTDITDSFVDINFQAALREILGKADYEPIFCEDVEKLTYLDVSG